MDRFNEILLDVWREACRHIEITELTTTVTYMLAQHMPLGQVFVRQIDPVRHWVETVAVGIERGEETLPPARTERAAPEMNAITAWSRRGDVSCWGAGVARSGSSAYVVPDDVEGDVLVGPLGGPDRSHGALILVAAPSQVFDERHVAMAKVLLEPFSVALENDHRLREMVNLREAAEADKQSLLSRLGRKQIGGDSIIGAGSGLRSVMERVQLVVRSDVPVLILGETGSGKEVIARAIHTRSARAAGPFIRVNCGAIPTELIDAQLFGHEKGAFTGAVEMRKGWFERADGGTLLLDEIGELPLAAQVRLLRILQDGWLERVGGHHAINVNVRIVASTHRDLAQMVAEGKFREDLWYRIAVFPILLPPLRERVSDIPILARHFAERAATRFGLPVLMPTDEDNALLMSYAWPGNVRELGTVLDRAAIIGNGHRLEVAKALGVMGPAPNATQEPNRASTGPAPEPSEFLSLDDAMRKHIAEALTLTEGRIEGKRGAARLLKINAQTLRSRMLRLGINRLHLPG
ncbi:MAG: sigma-54-dependent Fis family transcriptional regulator [Candidatus Hydrogenedentes bacterium]|nr:sigma-54-dependent Fis family transcriptional regulator [Candidatus Hydrogenedentota bacterium]